MSGAKRNKLGMPFLKKRRPGKINATVVKKKIALTSHFVG